MEHYVGIDVSLELSSVCVVNVGGKIVSETKIESHPDAIVNFLRSSLRRIHAQQAADDFEAVGFRRQSDHERAAT